MKQGKAAIDAWNKGFHVFPVEPDGKTPIRIYQDRHKDEAPWTVKWSEIATNDIDTILKWWHYAPTANVGIACKPSGLFVVDCDRPKRDYVLSGTRWEYLHDLCGPLVDGETLFDQVAERYGGTGALATVFDTYTVATGSGGKHFYYTWPDTVHSTQDSIFKGLLDVRGNGGTSGGYVLGAGSCTVNGGYVTELDVDVQPAPGWLVKLCTEREPYRSPKSPVAQPRSVAWGGLEQTVRCAQEGNRNNSLLWAARAMCADGATEEECTDLLVPAALANGLDGGERQASQTIRSAYRLQQRKM